MVGVKEICALLLAGGVGAGSVVTVLHAVPAAKKVTRQQPAKPQARKAPRPAGAATTVLTDCGGPLGVLGQNMSLPPLAPIEVAPGLPFGQTAMAGGSLPGGGGFIALPPSVGGGSESGGGVAVVPEAGTWAMLIAGFGLVGLAIRRGSRKEDRDQSA